MYPAIMSEFVIRKPASITKFHQRLHPFMPVHVMNPMIDRSHSPRKTNFRIAKPMMTRIHMRQHIVTNLSKIYVSITIFTGMARTACYRFATRN